MADSVRLGSIEIILELEEDGGVAHGIHTEGDADNLMTALGMMKLAEDSLIRRSMGEEEAT